MSGKLGYGKPKEAYHIGTNYYAWKFPGGLDDTAPEWVTREIGERLKKLEDGSWKFQNVVLNRGDVFMYNSIKRALSVSDDGIFQSHFFVRDGNNGETSIKTDLEEVSKDENEDSDGELEVN